MTAVYDRREAGKKGGEASSFEPPLGVPKIGAVVDMILALGWNPKDRVGAEGLVRVHGCRKVMEWLSKAVDKENPAGYLRGCAGVEEKDSGKKGGLVAVTDEEAYEAPQGQYLSPRQKKTFPAQVKMRARLLLGRRQYARHYGEAAAIEHYRCDATSWEAGERELIELQAEGVLEAVREDAREASREGGKARRGETDYEGRARSEAAAAQDAQSEYFRELSRRAHEAAPKEEIADEEAYFQSVKGVLGKSLGKTP